MYLPSRVYSRVAREIWFTHRQVRPTDGGNAFSPLSRQFLFRAFLFLSFFWTEESTRWTESGRIGMLPRTNAATVSTVIDSCRKAATTRRGTYLRVCARSWRVCAVRFGTCARSRRVKVAKRKKIAARSYNIRDANFEPEDSEKCRSTRVGNARAAASIGIGSESRA